MKTPTIDMFVDRISDKKKAICIVSPDMMARITSELAEIPTAFLTERRMDSDTAPHHPAMAGLGYRGSLFNVLVYVNHIAPPGTMLCLREV